MHLNTLASFLLLTLSSAASPPNPSPSPSPSPCGGPRCDSPTSTLTAAVRAWDGTTFGATSVQSAEQSLESCLSSAGSGANSSPTQTETQAQACIDYLGATLEPQVRYAVGNLSARYTDFKSAGLVPTIENDLKSLKSKIDNLGSAVIAKAPADKKSAAQAVLNSLDKDVASGVNKFAS